MGFARGTTVDWRRGHALLVALLPTAWVAALTIGCRPESVTGARDRLSSGGDRTITYRLPPAREAYGTREFLEDADGESLVTPLAELLTVAPGEPVEIRPDGATLVDRLAGQLEAGAQAVWHAPGRIGPPLSRLMLGTGLCHVELLLYDRFRSPLQDRSRLLVAGDSGRVSVASGSTTSPGAHGSGYLADFMGKLVWPDHGMAVEASVGTPDGSPSMAWRCSETR